MKLLISAAEASSDLVGSHLLRALHEIEESQGKVEAFGIGGDRLRAAGLRTVVDARELLAMGSVEVLGRLPRILQSLDKIVDEAARVKPDLAIVIDYPDFHFRLAKRLRKQGIPVIYFVPPKVWVWRKKRIHRIRETFSHVMCIFPFEAELYRKNDVPVTYVGNPLADSLPLQLDRRSARAQLVPSLRDEDRVALVMPGSRPAELKYHLELMLDSTVMAAAQLRHRGFLRANEPLHVLVPISSTIDFESVERKIIQWLNKVSGGTARLGGASTDSSFIVRVYPLRGQSAEAMVAADVGLVKSGTSTLEAGVLGCPHTVVYKPSWLTGWVFNHLLSYKGPVGLVNLFQGWKEGDRYLAKEILCGDVRVPALAGELVSLLTDHSRRERMLADFALLRRSVLGNAGDGPSLTAARTVWDVYRQVNLAQVRGG